MIIRFLNGNKVFEVNEDDSPLLIYANRKEKERISKALDGECVIISKEDPRGVSDLLNSPEEPIRMKK